MEDDNSPASKRPKLIRDVYERRMRNASVVFQGLFNGNLFGEVLDGQKRACVFFRQLCINPYPKEKELGNLFMENREDVSNLAVKNWLESNSKEFMASFRNRRSGLIRFVKEAISIQLGIGRIPLENGVPVVLQEWRKKVRDAWAAAKLAAKGEGLFYPRAVSQFLFEHAKVSDTYSTFSCGHCPDDLLRDLWWSNLIILEAFALNVISTSFGGRTSDGNIECCEKNLGGEVLKEFSQLVLRQRSRYEPEESL